MPCISAAGHPTQYMLLPGAQAVASDSTNGYSGGATAFASASARFTIVRQCLLNATISASAAASTAVSTAQTAIATSNTTSATNAIQSSICNPVTATAVAQAFAEAIATGTGCNGAVYTAISSKFVCAWIITSHDCSCHFSRPHAGLSV